MEEIPGDRKPGRCLWGPRRRPLSVNGAESSPSGRGGDGCQERISMTKGRWDAFSSLLLPREGPPPLNSNAMGVCYANILLSVNALSDNVVVVLLDLFVSDAARSQL